jgi:hypothetical protein
MKLKTTLAALALALTPGLAAAYCGGEKAKITASACGEGQVYDAATATCVLKPTS